ncbi:MAG: protein TolR [Nitrospirae bacterium]|nr:protein TolR [Nitrospirota bacterium]
MQGTGRNERRAMAEINVTPLVDVMLVLLVIFMVTAPMMQQGVDVNLPQARGKAMAPAERVVVSVKRNEDVLVNGSKVEMRELQAKLAAMFRDKADKEVFLQADQSVPYGAVARVMGEIREAGIEKLGMVTEPLQK